MKTFFLLFFILLRKKRNETLNCWNWNTFTLFSATWVYTSFFFSFLFFFWIIYIYLFFIFNETGDHYIIERLRSPLTVSVPPIAKHKVACELQTVQPYYTFFHSFSTLHIIFRYLYVSGTCFVFCWGYVSRLKNELWFFIHPSKSVYEKKVSSCLEIRPVEKISGLLQAHPVRWKASRIYRCKSCRVWK